MPSLTWPSKAAPVNKKTDIELDSLVFPQGIGYPEAIPQNRLILGDNLEAMQALLDEYENRIQLIYVDPPFFTNRSFSTRVGRGEDSRKPKDWQLSEGYPDHWSSLDAYLDMLYPRLAMMHKLLAPTGTLYLHLDWHANAYARILLDEIFGPDRFLNEIIWVYHGPSPIRSAFNRKHDTILVYTKSDQYTFYADAVRQPYDPNTIKTFNSSLKAGFGKVPNLIRGKVPEDWWYFPVVARLHNERTGYPTQKPQALLERIILASSNPGDIVADFFCGSGTTPLMATRLDRQFIASDITRRAIHTTCTRLVALPSSPFRIEHTQGQKLNYEHLTTLDCQINARGELEIDTASLEEIDYWEIDPAWDGKIFRSAAQAFRPRQKGGISPTLPIKDKQGNDNFSIRIVNIHGAAFKYDYSPPKGQ
jgi:site-specific DNA-methyltransferase (adenine-specific)